MPVSTFSTKRHQLKMVVLNFSNESKSALNILHPVSENYFDAIFVLFDCQDMLR